MTELYHFIRPNGAPPRPSPVSPLDVARAASANPVSRRIRREYGSDHE